MTEVVIAAIAGCLFGGGIIFGVRGAVTKSTPLAELVEQLVRPRDNVPVREGALEQLIDDISKIGLAGRESDLAVVEKTLREFAVTRLTWAMLGATGGLIAIAAWQFGFVEFLSFPTALALVILGALGGWLYAVVDLRSDALKARREFAHSLAAYLELVSILMAGGAGTETALHEAAAIGSSRGFRHLRAALSVADARREPPWATFGELGRRLGIPELIALEASMTLAGSGAQVKDSLSVRADGMRVRDLQRQEAEQHVKSETMVLPVAMMFAGFLLLIGYPAIAGLSV